MLENFDIIDISPKISASLAVFPGDTPFERVIDMNCQNGANHLTLSHIKTTLHLGAHTDAPNHYHQNGTSIENRDLSYYLGSCQVIEVHLAAGERIKVQHIDQKIRAKRILFKTNSYSNPNQWSSQFNALSSELIHFLASKNVILVGIDTPSIDPADDQTLESHKAVYQNNLAILEGIILTDVDQGIYQLIALPLPIVDADASPVRAILLREKS